MTMQDYISGYGVDLINLKIKPGHADDRYVYDPHSSYGYTTVSDIFSGSRFGNDSDSLCSIARRACDNRVLVFHSNVYGEGECFIHIPDQLVKVGTDPASVHFYNEPTAKQVLFTNVVKVLIALKNETGLAGFTTKADVINLVNSAKWERKTYDPSFGV